MSNKTFVTLAQVFSCKFCEISKNIFFHRTPLAAAPVLLKLNLEAELVIRGFTNSSTREFLFFTNILILHLFTKPGLEKVYNATDLYKLRPKLFSC